MDKDMRTKLEETSEKNYPKVRQEMVAMLAIEERAKLYAERRFAETITMTRKEWEGYLNDTPYEWTMSQSNECGQILRYINGVPVIVTDEDIK